MTSISELTVTKSDVESFAKSMNDPQWLMDIRTTAMDKVATLDMPKADKTKLDKWNFFNVESLNVDGESFDSLNDLPEDAKQLIDIESVQNIYVQHNNTKAYLQLDDELINQGVILQDIKTAVTEHSELVQKYFMQDGVKVDENKLTALHAALMNGGLFLYVPKNVEVKEPIQMVTIHDDENASLYNHVLIVAEESAQVTYVENYISTVDRSNGQLNVVSEVIAKDNAQVTYGAVDFLTEGFTGYVNRRGVAARDAVIDWALGLMNDGDTINDNTTYLMGDNSSSDLKTVVVGRGEQKLNFTTQIIHYGKDSIGHILKHGVMKDAASSIFNGVGYIKKAASGSDAQQESRVLMLSEKARGDANPILLIDEDDVTAGHAASVGRVDPMQLFYLMSRGISQEEAERLVIHGFLDPVVRELPIESVQKQLREVIEQKVLS